MGHKSVGKLHLFGLVFAMSPGKFVEMIIWSVFDITLSILTVWISGRIVSLLFTGYSKAMLGTVCLYGGLLSMSASYSIYYKRYRVQFRVIPAFEQKIRSNLFKKSCRISNEAYLRRSAFGDRLDLLRF